MMSEAPAILAEGLVKTYGTTTALAGLALTVPAGTVYGLLGPNGAGKTTAVRVFSTLLRPNRGRAQVLGHDVVTEATQVRRMIGLTGQYAALDEYLTGRANLVMIGQLSRLTADAARRRADEMLERFDLTEAAGRAGHTHPGGQRRGPDRAAQPDRLSVGAVPGRADHRPGPERPRHDLGNRAGARGLGGDAAAHHAVPGRGRTAGPAASGDRRGGGEWRTDR